MGHVIAILNISTSTEVHVHHPVHVRVYVDLSMAAQLTQVPDLCALYLVPVYVHERDCVYQECMKPARMWASCASVCTHWSWEHH